MAAAITTKNLTKTYKTRQGRRVNVVDDLNLEVEEGEIFGFLGPNGAGKTTTIKMLLGIIDPTSGVGEIFGKQIGDIGVHRIISYLPEKPYYYEHMTGMEILRYYSALFGINDPALCQRLLERVNLAGDASKTISQYSKGMQQRIGLAQSLLNDPKLLFLDEPTGGLDPIAHIEIRDLILQFREEGKTVFISSHELSDVERICDRVAIINFGKIARQGKLEDLLKGGRVEIIADDTPEAIAANVRSEVEKDGKDGMASYRNGRLIVDVNEDEDVNAILDSVRSSGGRVISVIPRRKRLEDLFLETVKSPETMGKVTA